MDAKDSDGRTALMRASVYGHDHAVEELIKKGTSGHTAK